MSEFLDFNNENIKDVIKAPVPVLDEQKVPDALAPVLDEQQIEENESLEELLEKKIELEEKMAKGEDVHSQYQLIVDKIMKIMEKQNIPDKEKNKRIRASKKQKEDERLEAIERYKNSLNKLFNKDETSSGDIYNTEIYKERIRIKKDQEAIANAKKRMKGQWGRQGHRI